MTRQWLLEKIFKRAKFWFIGTSTFAACLGVSDVVLLTMFARCGSLMVGMDDVIRQARLDE